MMRSKLFVPAARPELFEKALASEADAISFDLEDAVPSEGKAAARKVLSTFLASDAARASAKRLIVRVNGIETPFMRGDLAALANTGVHIVNIPKVESPEQVAALVSATDLPILANVETARGLRRAAEIAAAHTRVIGLQAGLNDLFVQLGADRSNAAAVQAALWPLRLAAGEAGCFAYDGAWLDMADEDGFRAEAEMARSLGFLGKSCIHPRQVPIANAVFAAPDALADAQRLLIAAEAAAARGHGAFAFEGRMIDRPEIERAKAIVGSARGQK